jgi:hypothetical protein
MGAACSRNVQVENSNEINTRAEEKVKPTLNIIDQKSPETPVTRLRMKNSPSTFSEDGFLDEKLLSPTEVVLFY